MIRQGMGAIAVLMLAACSHVHTVSSTSAPTGNSESCDEVMEFYSVVSRLSAEAEKELLQTLRTSSAQGGNSCDQLRLAILLGKPGTNFRDNVAAGMLLKDFLENSPLTDAASQSLAHLLIDIAAAEEQQQVDLHRLKKAISQEQAISQVLARKLKRQHTATKALQSQMDQLKSIERDINEKEQSAATSTPDKGTDESDQNTPD
ncbi:hypothetical protein MNBD_GAMMA17-986 [hydrothermal vent metagenome]|uniref:Lipoprotein n=1 Tax=hydrothermal vent metagenome TaxID=652676 RepID=A0A3B0ZQP5_9ZZZZ